MAGKITAALLALILAVALDPGAAHADDCPPADAAVDGVTDQFPPPPATDPAHLRKIEVQLGADVYVHVKNLKALLACQKTMQPSKAIVLFLDQNQLANVVGTPAAAVDDKGDGYLHFALLRAAPGKGSKDAWVPILGRPSLQPRRDIGVSVGFADQFAINSTARLDFRTIPQLDFAIGLVFFLALLIAFGIAVVCSNILRDSPVEGVDGPGAFSLSKSHAALWFFVILGSYILIAAITGEFTGTLTGTALTLLGIGAATAAGSAVVGASKDASTDKVSQQGIIDKTTADLAAKDAAIKALMDQLKTPPPDKTRQSIEAEIKRAKAERTVLDQLHKKATNQSINFVIDILSDANGVNFQRFQMVGWTLVLGFIFAREVYDTLGMPDFDTNLLVLQGVSAATFVGLKMTEPTVPNAKT